LATNFLNCAVISVLLRRLKFKGAMRMKTISGKLRGLIRSGSIVI
jgi:hypothetical protein